MQIGKLQTERRRWWNEERKEREEDEENKEREGAGKGMMRGVRGETKWEKTKD